MKLTIPLNDISTHDFNTFKNCLGNKRLVALFYHAPNGLLYAVTAKDEEGLLEVISTKISNQSYPSLTADYPSAHLFEREILEQHSITPEGHPWPKPVRFSKDTIGETNFFHIDGAEAHEVAVGPVHAGVIEPGHFRFQCHGETVYHLEISLGYQHRGIEKNLVNGPHSRTLFQMETVAGDTTIGHTWNYCKNIESLANVSIDTRSNLLRALMLELERLANHVGDLGALAGDVGFLPTMSYCGRLRGEYLNMSAFICGSRFGRAMVCPGGVNFDLDNAQIQKLISWIDTVFKDTKGAIDLLWNSNMVLNRFEKTGMVSSEDAIQLGLVGIAAKSCGLSIDTRKNNPIYQDLCHFSCPTGDVHARALVRWQEIQSSYQFVRAALLKLKDLPQSSREKIVALAPNMFSISLTEGWRGEICHIAITDGNGKFANYKIIDPSFHNWIALALSLRGQEISDFPLCNKSFNLSYCGHDL